MHVSINAVKEFVGANGLTQRELVPGNIVLPKRNEKNIDFNFNMGCTTYRVNVTAISPDFSYHPPWSLHFTTEEAVPPDIAPPILYGVTESGTIMVVLPRASEIFGPVSQYLLVVVPESWTTANLSADDYHLSDNGGDIVRISNIAPHALHPEDWPYVAVKFLGQDIPYIFNLGDNASSYGYFNRQLQKHKRYRIFLRARIDRIVTRYYANQNSTFLALRDCRCAHHLRHPCLLGTCLARDVPNDLKPMKSKVIACRIHFQLDRAPKLKYDISTTN
ncbi:unnamed protein product [Darwinula stevensoni]|uniref:Uncharacterized protein n=1 Tax=Darwinula stevensoni TaxID=69355 RepID=A0A7R8XAF1_9CRUS|nr:unnamed protein product [Darwinula stevensoni]CAG0885411.1 unnamed protein product [Darwinula stevensoni]